MIVDTSGSIGQRITVNKYSLICEFLRTSDKRKGLKEGKVYIAENSTSNNPMTWDQYCKSYSNIYIPELKQYFPVTSFKDVIKHRNDQLDNILG